jgi:hypothetical protein
LHTDVPVNRRKKWHPSPPPDAVSHGKPDAPIRPDRRPFLSVHTSSPRATHGRSRGCKVRPAPEATSSPPRPPRCIVRSITISRGQSGVAPSCCCRAVRAIQSDANTKVGRRTTLWIPGVRPARFLERYLGCLIPRRPQATTWASWRGTRGRMPLSVSHHPPCP